MRFRRSSSERNCTGDDLLMEDVVQPHIFPLLWVEEEHGVGDLANVIALLSQLVLLQLESTCNGENLYYLA